MAITTNSLGILSALYPSASDMGRVLTVGRLGLYAPEVFLRDVRARWGRKPELGNEPVPKYFDELLGQCGVAEVSALDGSDYEGAHLVHDLNQPVPESWTESFDTIVDAGTLEHIFQAVQALGSLMKMVKVGGRLLLFDMPTNNLSGHGFYQFSPIFFSETLSPTYGFQTRCVVGGRGHALRGPPRDHADDAQCGRANRVGRRQALLYLRFRYQGSTFPRLPGPCYPTGLSGPLESERNSAPSFSFGGKDAKNEAGRALARLLSILARQESAPRASCEPIVTIRDLAQRQRFKPLIRRAGSRHRQNLWTASKCRSGRKATT